MIRTTKVVDPKRRSKSISKGSISVLELWEDRCSLTFALSVGSTGESPSNRTVAVSTQPRAAAQSSGVQRFAFLKIKGHMGQKVLSGQLENRKGVEKKNKK